ncbi:hypothetical protein AJ80_05239 [Polytolypa hystricis UAMH7299]|uniref:RNA polymerase II subunit A C-terminal domain phosphatase n=1 Tax=Polytolypa hystricis (strain UAMH7299) TaxID=1447883 RepID=A0A2B7Y3Z9_POLH7|nr:hypothetical protein AJ80_05239 [Polytolypa hystricis UAMH7299]
MLLKLSSSLHYPITVTELLKQPGDTVEHGEALFAYFYRTTVTEGDGLGNKHDVVKMFPSRYESAVDGTLVQWRIKAGEVLDAPIDFAEVDEPCSHEVQFGGMCANCGKDMTHASYNTDFLDSSRAPIRMVHDNTSLTVSQDVATQVEEEAKRRLLSSRRLSLVVDLDQTIIHATVDPTVAEWQQDKDNPNHEAVKDVRAFQLIDDGPGMKGCWYYIKLRPGLEEFLRKVSTLYELHIYTMGTRAYAQNIANIVDPDRKIFGDRILSRDESGSLTAKNLQRLFPVDTKMVVIIDDRGDVWKWTDNLIKVSPYDFFVGIGDINSSFLPKKPELKPIPKAEVKARKEQAKANEDAANGAEPTGEDRQEVSALEQLVTMGGGDNPVLLQEQTSQQEEAIAHQVEERPLLQKQKQLDAEDEAADVLAAENGELSSEDSHDSSRHRHHLLEDNDAELFQLQERLERIHQNFFEEYDLRRTQSLGGRVTALRGERIHQKDKGIDIRIVPDVKIIMPQIKRQILANVVMVFSGVLPLGTDTQNADISLWAKSFGATIAHKINSKATHLVAGRNRTAKVREATRYPKIKIVTLQWLLDSLTHWKHFDEEPYMVPVHPEDRGEPIGSSENSPTSKGSNGNLDDTAMLSSSEEDDSSTMSDDDQSVASRSQIQTDELEHVDEEIGLSAGLDEHSPIGYDAEQKAAVHDELAAFLGSDNEDSESDSEFAFSLPEHGGEGSNNNSLPTGRKRKREGVESSDEDSGAEGIGQESDGEKQPATSTPSSSKTKAKGSPLSRKIKRSHQRSTGLKEVATVISRASSEGPRAGDDDVGGLEDDPEGVGDESDTTEDYDIEMANTNSNNPSANDDAEDGQDDLEREMLAALEGEDWDDSGAQGG